MGVISNPSNFFGNGATQQSGAKHYDDKLKNTVLVSRQKDAAFVRRGLNWLAHWLLQPEGRGGDQMEQATLACQRRDAAVVKHLLLG